MFSLILSIFFRSVVTKRSNSKLFQTVWKSRFVASTFGARIVTSGKVYFLTNAIPPLLSSIRLATARAVKQSWISIHYRASSALRLKNPGRPISMYCLYGYTVAHRILYDPPPPTTSHTRVNKQDIASETVSKCQTILLSHKYFRVCIKPVRSDDCVIY